MALAWGPLQSLYELLASEAQVADGERDRKQTDLTLARTLSSDQMSTALAMASIEQLDLALAHDALAIERKPLSYLTILIEKSVKMEQWGAKRVSADEKALRRTAQLHFVHQVSNFLCQVPVYVATKELKRVSKMVALYTNLMIDLKQTIRAVFPLKSFLRRFHQHGHHVITAIHPQFFYVCLQAKCYSAAMEILTQPLFEVHVLATEKDFLGYAYYGGLLFVGEKRFQEAMDFFRMAVTAPAVSLSVFVVKSYKLLILSSLILHGTAPTLPKYTPFVVTRHLETQCAPYVELMRAMTVEKSVERVVQVVEAQSDVFINDGNLGLVKQVIEALKQQKLCQLPRTYVTIALNELTRAAEMETSGGAIAAEKLLLKLIERGDVAAVIDKQRAMVKFVLDDALERGESDSGGGDLDQMLAMEKLQSEMEKLVLISAQLRSVDMDIVTSSKFQSRAQKDKDRRQRGSQAGDERYERESVPWMGGDHPVN